MAGAADRLSRLLALLQGLDDAAYSAMASKGLLRRARKDIDKGVTVELADCDGETVSVQVDTQLVSMDAAGPAAARCSCPAPGACQHILIACLQLPSLAAAGETPPGAAEPAPDPWLALDEQALKRWAGHGAYRQACRLALDQLAGVENAWVRFQTGVVCHLVPGAGLEGIITTAAPRFTRAYAAAAVLAYRGKHGRGWVAGLGAADIGSSADQQLLKAVQRLLEEYIELGLNHLSPTSAGRLQTLAMQCRSARYYRAANELDSCAKDIEWLLARHAQADTQRLFDRMARLYALAEALAGHGPSAPIELLGAVRSHYRGQDALDLVGMGAYPWETDSGYWGITALFWSPSQARFYSWSELRPRTAGDGFTPARRYQAQSPWPGGGLLQTLCRSAFRLIQPRINEQRRLSLSQQSRVEAVGPRTSTGLPPVETDWRRLAAAHAQRRGLGLRRHQPLDDVFLIEPADWGQPGFDEIEQQLVIPVADAGGENLSVVLPYTELTADPIRHLERLKPAKGWRFLVYYRYRPTPSLLPIAAYGAGDALDPQTDLLFVSLPARYVKRWRERIRHALPAWALPVPSEASEASNDAPLTALQQRLSGVDTLLHQRAESGLHLPCEADTGIVQRLQATGLLQLARALERTGNETTRARDVLIARYLYLLHLQAE